MVMAGVCMRTRRAGITVGIARAIVSLLSVCLSKPYSGWRCCCAAAMPTANEPSYDQLTKQLREVKPCIIYKINSTDEYTALLATDRKSVV